MAFCASSFPNNFLKKPPTFVITFPKNKKVCMIPFTANPSTPPIICANPIKRGIINCNAPPTTLAIVLNASNIVLAKICPCEPASPAALIKLPNKLMIIPKTALNIVPKTDNEAPTAPQTTVVNVPIP